MVEQGLTGRDLRNAILFAALVYLAMQFIGQIADVLIVFSIIALLVIALNPAVSWMESHKVPRGVGTAALALVSISILALLLFLIIPMLEKQAVQVAGQASGIVSEIEPWTKRLKEEHPSLAPYVPTPVSLIQSIPVRQIGPSVLGGVSRIGASAVTLLASALLIFISTVYSLANPRPLTTGLLRVFKPQHRPRAEMAAQKLASQIRAWAKANIIAMFSIFLLTWIALSIIGLKQAFLFAVIAGILEAVPIIGPILSAIPPLLVTIFLSPITALWVVLAFIIIQQFENHVLVPMIMSRELSLHPITVIFAVLVMGGLFGIVGVFLASPAAATVGIIYEELYQRSYSEAPGGVEEATS